MSWLKELLGDVLIELTSKKENDRRSTNLLPGFLEVADVGASCLAGTSAPIIA